MKKRKISTAAFLAGVTTLAVSLPAMAETRSAFDVKETTATAQKVDDYINGEDFQWFDEDTKGV